MKELQILRLKVFNLGKTDILKVLLKNGANINKDGKIALHIAF